MFRNHFLFAALLGISLLTSCIIPSVRNERKELDLQRNDSLFVIDEGDFHFQLVLPKDLMITNEPAIHISHDQTTLHITCGEDFQVVVTMPSSAKSANTIGSGQDGVFTHKMIDCEDESCVYKRMLPDGSSFDYGLYQLTTIGKTTYVFQSAPEGEFDLSSVMRMKLALASVKI